MGLGLGIIGGAMQGGGEGGMQAAKNLGEYLTRSQLQEEANIAMTARDARLSELRKGELEHAENLRREPGRKAAEEIDRARATPAYDPATDSVRPKTRTESSADEAGAYRRQGLISEAIQTQSLEEQRAARAEGHQVTREGQADSRDYHAAMVKIQQAAEGRLAAGAKIDNEIKTLTLENVKRVDALRKEFSDPATAADRKRAINEEMQILTGKDNDKFLPVPIKNDQGDITGYRIFDTKGGRWVDSAPAAAPKAGERPALDSFFGNKAKPKEPTGPGTEIVQSRPDAKSSQPSQPAAASAHAVLRALEAVSANDPAAMSESEVRTSLAQLQTLERQANTSVMEDVGRRSSAVITDYKKKLIARYKELGLQ